MAYPGRHVVREEELQGTGIGEWDLGGLQRRELITHGIEMSRKLSCHLLVGHSREEAPRVEWSGTVLRLVIAAILKKCLSPSLASKQIF